LDQFASLENLSSYPVFGPGLFSTPEDIIGRGFSRSILLRQPDRVDFMKDLEEGDGQEISRLPWREAAKEKQGILTDDFGLGEVSLLPVCAFITNELTLA